jgi:hypothetical protein
MTADEKENLLQLLLSNNLKRQKQNVTKIKNELQQTKCRNSFLHLRQCDRVIGC